MLRTNDIKGA